MCVCVCVCVHARILCIQNCEHIHAEKRVCACTRIGNVLGCLNSCAQSLHVAMPCPGQGARVGANRWSLCAQGTCTCIGSVQAWLWGHQAVQGCPYKAHVQVHE